VGRRRAASEPGFVTGRTNFVTARRALRAAAAIRRMVAWVMDPLRLARRVADG
jgi:hypothetical protein